jgi:hypothetical protein
MAVNGYAIASVGVGSLLLWSAVHNEKISATTRDVISGKKPPKDGPPSIADDTTSGGGNAATGGSAPSAPTSVSGNVAIGKMLASARGWGSGSEWDSLYNLWERESGWSNVAENESSGAYGIAQALGHGPTNQYPAGPANPPTSSATAQILWGLGYISATYGDPNAAWAHEVSEGWY